MTRPIVTSMLALLVQVGCSGIRERGGTESSGTSSEAALGPASATYSIESDSVTLVDGRASRPVVPGSAERVETRVVGDPVKGDLDGDGDEDAALILMHRAGGSGTFYYVAAAIRQSDGYHGTNAIFVGDRITVQSIEVRHGVVMVNYAERRNSEAMATEPSQAATRFVTLHGTQLVTSPPVGN